MEFCIRVECVDCTGIDPHGCFAGGHGYVITDGNRCHVHDQPVSASHAASFPRRDQAQRVLDCLEQDDDWPAAWEGEVIKRPAAPTGASEGWER